MLLNCGFAEDSWESLGMQGDPTSPSQRRSVLGVHWKDCVEAETPILWPPDAKSWLIWKDPDAGKDWGQEEKGTTEDKMASPTQWTWVWVDFRSWWWTGRPGVLWFMGLQRVRHDKQLNDWLYNIVAGFAIHSHESAMGIHVFPVLNSPFHLPPHPIPQGHPSASALSILSHVSNLDWWYISHMIISVFQWYSLKSSHPCLLPQNPKVCSLPMCLFCCLAYRVIVTIF